MRSAVLVGAVILYLFSQLFFTPRAYSALEPQFSSCANPSGEVKVRYEGGVHGIVGDSNVYEGKDTVYKQPQGNFLQCFCANSGDGIETRWWNARDLTSDDIKIRIHEGWKLINNGRTWGLTDDPYLAQNSTYSCRGTSTSTQASIGGINNNISSNVLALATTGNKKIIAMYLLLGFTSLLCGVLLKNVSNKTRYS